MVLSGIRPSFPGLSRSAGQITHVLLTRSPLEYPASRAFPFDLHVLSTPPAFVLSQDQTLHKSNKPYKEPSPAQQKTELLTSGTKTGHPRTTPVGGPGPHAGHKNQQTENKRSIFNKQSPTCRDHPNRLHHLRLVKTWFITLLSSQTTTAHHEPQPRKTTPSRPQRPDIIYTPHHTTTNPQVNPTPSPFPHRRQYSRQPESQHSHPQLTPTGSPPPGPSRSGPRRFSCATPAHRRPPHSIPDRSPSPRPCSAAVPC